MPSNRTPTRIVGPSLVPGTGTSVYTVPGSKIVVIRSITLSAWDATMSVAIGIGSSSADDIFATIASPASGPGDANNWFYEVMSAGEELFVDGLGTANSVTITVNADVYDA